MFSFTVFQCCLRQIAESIITWNRNISTRFLWDQTRWTFLRRNPLRRTLPVLLKYDWHLNNAKDSYRYCNRLRMMYQFVYQKYDSLLLYVKLFDLRQFIIWHLDPFICVLSLYSNMRRLWLRRSSWLIYRVQFCDHGSWGTASWQTDGQTFIGGQRISF